MFLFYLSSFILAIVVILYFGIELSKLVVHPTFYIFFWILYSVSVLVIINLAINIRTTYSIELKEGKPGPSGEKGSQGTEGPEAKCEAGCKNKVCHLKIMRKLEENYNKILGKSYGKELDQPKIINNRYLRETVKRVCHSKQFKEVSQLQHPFKVLEYITEIFGGWIQLLAEADTSEHKKHLQDYLGTYGQEREWESMITPSKNPFKEIEKYDVYYWGLKKEFHPRKIQAPVKPPGMKNKNLRRGEIAEPKIRAYKTNIYKRIYTDRGTGAEHNAAVWVSPPHQINNKIYWPLGSVVTPYHSQVSWKKYISRMGKNNDARFNIRGSRQLGPNTTNVMVNGSKHWVRRPHPKHWSWQWNDNETGGNTDVTFWNAEDFREDGQLYRCFGGMVTKNHSWHNPSRQLGRNGVPFVCINDKALDPIPHRHNFVWNDGGSGGEHDGSIWTNYDGDYNLAYFQKGHRPNGGRRAYKIKDSFLEGEAEKPFTSDKEEDFKVGYGYHNRSDFKRDRATSVFELLDLVMESDIESQNHQQKLFLSHSGLNDPNSYLIREYDQDTFAMGKCLKASDNGQVAACNTTKPEQIWIIDFLGSSKELCLLKSKKTGQYLKSIKPWTYQASGKIPTRNSSDPSLKPFLWKLTPKEGQK